jgi:peptide/nickel transport system substrate-binding protein
MNLSRVLIAGSTALCLCACSAWPLPSATVEPPSLPTTTPTLQSTPTQSPELPERTLNICAGSEPVDLFVYNEDSAIKRAIFAAIYAGPITHVGTSYQAVMLEKLPSLADGDAWLEPVTVRQGDRVMDSSGAPATLEPGVSVRPAGCRDGDCAVTYAGGELQMERLRVVFQMHHDVRWQDGETIDAWDSVFGYRVASDPETLYGNHGLVTGSAASLTFTVDYSALDDFTLQWTGVAGFIDPNYPLNFFQPLPEHVLSEYTLSDLLASNEALYQPLAWGSYQVASWESGVQIVLEKNPTFTSPTPDFPAFDQLVFKFPGAEQVPVVDRFARGDCDLVLPDTTSETLEYAFMEMANAGTVRLVAEPEPIFEYLVFNTDPADPGIIPIFADVRTRQATALCLDRKTLTDAVYAGYVPALDQLLPTGDALLVDAGLPGYPGDSTAGALLLEAIGWRDPDADGVRQAVGIPGISDGTPLRLTLTSTDAPQRDQVGSWIVYQLQGCGMEVSLLQSPARDLLAQTPEALLSGRRFDLAETSSPLGIEALCDLGLTSEIASEANGWSGTNLSGYSNPVFDAACTASAAAIPGMAEYLSSRQAVLRILNQDMPIVPLFLHTRFVVAVASLFNPQYPDGPPELWFFREP